MIGMNDRRACLLGLFAFLLTSLVAGCGGNDQTPSGPTSSGDVGLVERPQGDLGSGPQALKRLRKAAEAGSDPAMVRLARGYRDGEFGEPNPALAASWFERLVAKGQREPKTELAELLLAKKTGGADAKRRAIRLLEERVEDGDPRAMILRANLMDNRAGKISRKQAFALYSKAAALGSNEGLYWLGQHYFDGNGVEQDRPHAVGLWYDAADQSSTKALLALGDLFAWDQERVLDQEALKLVQENALRKGSNVARSIEDVLDDNETAGHVSLEPARSLYQQAADNGSMAGAIRLAAWLQRHDRTDEALDWYLPAATIGNVTAIRRLFEAFGDPEADRFNPAIMRQWLEQANALGTPWAKLEMAIAASGGHPFKVEGSTDDWLERAFRSDRGQSVAIAQAYREGRFGVPDNEAAAIWLSRGADTGDLDAMRALAKAYAEGRGFLRNWGEAQRWYRKAAEVGDVTAMRELAGLQLASGDSGQARLAVGWLEKAAKKGDVPAMRSLARTLISGIATAADPAEAAQWYRAAARAGDGEAYYQLGMMYLNGLGLEKDPRLARAFLTKALEQDIKQAAAALQMLDANGPQRSLSR